MNLYECTKCERIFDNFPAANNHEKATEYRHLDLLADLRHLTR